MRINFNKPILNIEDKPILIEGKEQTLRSIVPNMIAQQSTSNPKMTVDIARRIASNDGEVELSTKELQHITSLFLGKMFVNGQPLQDLIKGQILNLLEPK